VSKVLYFGSYYERYEGDKISNRLAARGFHWQAILYYAMPAINFLYPRMLIARFML